MRIALLAAFSLLTLPAQTISDLPLPSGTEQPGQSLVQLWATAARNPKSAEARANISFAMLSINRLQQAEWAARESLELDPASARAQLALGWTLARRYQYTAEALDCLRRAAHSFPEAHFGAADVLAHQGAVAEARAEVEAYLATGAPEHRNVAEKWLKLLN